MTDLPSYSPRNGSPRSTFSVLSAPPSYAQASNAGGSSRPIASRPGSSSHTPSVSRPSFSIGRKQTPALITTTDLKAHLVLLRAFYELREQIRLRASKSSATAENRLSFEQEWRVFLFRAVWRFELWLKHVVNRTPADYSQQYGPSPRWSDPRKIPPIDVLMVWHSYLLVS